MPDQLLALVPRNVEVEPGTRSTELFWDQQSRSLELSQDADGKPTAYFEPFAKRWLPMPLPQQSTETTADWTVTGSQTLLRGSASAPQRQPGGTLVLGSSGTSG